MVHQHLADRMYVLCRLVGQCRRVATDVLQALQVCRVTSDTHYQACLQIPFDSTVRVSLDTNLCMIKENPEDAPSCHESGR